MLAVTATKRLGTFVLDVRLQMPTPGVVALVGRSGSGKSTVVNLIAGLLRPESGRIVHDGAVLFDTETHVDTPSERRRIGYVFQDARLFPHLSVAGNLRYAEKRAVDPVYVDRDTVADLLALGSLMDRRTHQLSGGERQRLAIGRALLSQPRLLLLDEPLAALDGARREEVLPYLETLRDQLAIPMVYVTHRFDEVLRLATHIVLMEAGSVVAQGDVGTMSLNTHLRTLIGPDEVGAIVEGVVVGSDTLGGLTKVRLGRGELNVQVPHLAVGTALRVQLLARDIIVATQKPDFLSVRNSLAGIVTSIVSDDAESDLITLDIGGAHIMARITKSATRDLSLRPGVNAWALVKSVSLRGHSFRAPASAISASSPNA